MDNTDNQGITISCPASLDYGAEDWRQIIGYAWVSLPGDVGYIGGCVAAVSGQGDKEGINRG